MASGRCVGQRPDGHTFLCKFWYFQTAVNCLRLDQFTPNLGILQSLVCTSWLWGSIVANPIIYRLVPSPLRFETRQFSNLQSGQHSRIEYLRSRQVWYRQLVAGFAYKSIRLHLRWLKTVSSTFQDLNFDAGSLLLLFISWCYNHGIKKLPNHWWTRWYYFRDTIAYHSNAMTC